MVAVFQPGSGFVLAESSIVAHVNAALVCGAEVHGHEKLIRWEASESGFTIKTTHDRYEFGQLVFTAGAWIRKSVVGVGRVRPEPALLGWFRPRASPAL